MMNLSTTRTFGILSSAPNGGIVEHIFAHVHSVLLELKFDSQENENTITNRFCKALEFKKPPEYPYFFHHQNLEDNTANTSTDFSAFGTYAYAQEVLSDDIDEAPPLVKFEAKRLSADITTKREKEYVIGEYDKGVCIKNSGGIERFKNERHGKDVPHACIIAYVQSDLLANWLFKINGWITAEIKAPHDKQLSWGDTDLLIANRFVTDGSVYNSTHQRLSGDTIAMRHMWALASDNQVAS